MGAAPREVVAHKGFVLLTYGFFVCGFHVAFITAHFPVYVVDIGLPRHVGARFIAVVRLFKTDSPVSQRSP